MTGTVPRRRSSAIVPFDLRILHAALARASGFDTPGQVADAVRALDAAGALALPLPGGGATVTRFDALAEIAAVDLALARIAEGHTDAVAILAEAGRAPSPGIYGVWAADAPGSRVAAERTATGWRLRGRKRFCSGATTLDRALVTAFIEHDATGALFDLALASPGVEPVAGTWPAVGMAATDSLEVNFRDVVVPADSQIGEAGFYLERPGFWFGAVGVAACWAGGALGAYRMLRARLATGPCTEHQLAHLGAIAATCDAMHAQLAAAASSIDAGASGGRRLALVVRALVEQGCQDVLARTGRAGGTSPLVFDHAHARRAADLVVYLRQHHAERDLAELGRLVLEDQQCR